MPKSITIHCHDFKIQEYLSGTKRVYITKCRESDIAKIHSVVGQEHPAHMRFYTADKPTSYPYTSQLALHASKVRVSKNRNVSFTWAWKKP